MLAGCGHVCCLGACQLGLSGYAVVVGQVDWVSREAESLSALALKAARRGRRFPKGSKRCREVERAVRQIAKRVMFLGGVR